MQCRRSLQDGFEKQQIDFVSQVLSDKTPPHPKHGGDDVYAAPDIGRGIVERRKDIREQPPTTRRLQRDDDRERLSS